VDIHESVELILAAQDTWGERFYDVFLHQYPEVQEYFNGVNMRRQGVLLTMALIIVEQYYSGEYKATEKYLQYLGTKHDQMNIPQELYAKWTAALLTTLEQFHGDDWCDSLAQQWSQAIGRCVEVMLKGYGQHLTA
jgi:hemoglobin-like flavoprotein